ncbi:MAG: RNA polymerase factor sigma-54 [Candidatus Omnitrophica bacterium]|nr:RNA polymerase factor sigma-54 [Candidatus Omnitrophota bacterium]
MQAKQTIQQRLLLAPNVALALEILRMPTMELQAFLEQQMEENPLLELSESEEDAEDPSAEAEPASEETSQQADLDDPLLNPRQVAEAAENPDDDDAQLEEWLHSQRLVTRESLHQSLHLQWGCQTVDAQARKIGELLIQRLDEHGYLEGPLEEVAQEADSSVSRIEEVLRMIQQLDPPGVGARNLRECLLLQLEHGGFTQSLSYRILQDHFALFTQRRLGAIARATGRPVAEVEQACAQIRQLNPKPGRAFAGELPPSVIPDLIIRHREQHYDVELNDQELPQLNISRTYHRMLRDPRTPGDAKAFLMDKLHKASWLIKAIDERNATLLAIARCVISLQRDFLSQGPQALQPLTQAQVAGLVGRHPSTVSRAVFGKTIDTPYGIFRLEQLFASRVPQPSANGVSDAAIKAELERLLADEDPLHPLSDATIVKRLAARHIAVARRTIAKYRACLNILPAHLRRTCR